MRFKIKEKKDIEMAEIMGTVTSIKRYLSPESFIGLSELMNNGFDNSLLENPAIIETDYYGQRQSFIDLWKWLEKEELFTTSHTARTILENIEKSRVNIIASHEDESNSSIRYCNSFGIELTQHKYFSKEVTRWKTWFSKMKK